MTATTDEPILIWGAGAIGGILGAYWAKAGHSVLLVDNNTEHVAACNRDGIHIEGPVADFCQPIKAVTPDEIEGRWQHIVLAVKAQHTAPAMQTLLPHLADDGFVLSAQNGLNEHLIAQMAGSHRVMGAFVNYGADWMAPGHILYGNRGAVVVGEIDGQVRPRTQTMHALMQVFEPDAILSRDIWAYLWGKMGYGAMLFATALTHESMSQNFADPVRAVTLIALAREVMSIADAEGVTPKGFNGFDPAAFSHRANATTAAASIDELARFTARTAKTHSGIYRDMAIRKRKTEVDPQIGSMISIAEGHGIEAPLLRQLVELIHDIEDGHREQSAATFTALSKLTASRLQSKSGELGS